MEKITINGIRIWYDKNDCHGCGRDVVTCREVAEYLKTLMEQMEKPMIYNERRVADKGRGSVAWDENYERRSHPHKYED